MNNSNMYKLLTLFVLASILLAGCDIGADGNDNPGGVYLNGTYGRRVVSAGTEPPRVYRSTIYVSPAPTARPSRSV
jgi:hypothetical protein